jgi:hypothetical protein
MVDIVLVSAEWRKETTVNRHISEEDHEGSVSGGHSPSPLSAEAERQERLDTFASALVLLGVGDLGG